MSATPPDPSPSVAGWPLRALVVSAALAALGYLAVVAWGGWREVGAALGRVGLSGLGVALALSLVNYGLRFLRWQRFLGVLGYRLPAGAHLRIYLGGLALTTTPAKAGELLRSVFLKAHGVAYRASVAAFVSERLADLLAIVLLAAGGLWAYTPARVLVVATLGGVLGVITLLQNPGWLLRLERLAAPRLPRRIHGLLTTLADVAVHAGRCFRLPVLGFSVLLGLAAWGAEGVALHYIATLAGAELPLRTALFIYAFAVLVGALSFVPGGLGGTELTMVALLVANGLPEPQAVAVTVVIRLATLWFAVLLGIVALAGQRSPS